MQPLGNRDLIRAINRSLILNTIKTNGLIDRAEISRMVGLSPATVTAIAQELLDGNLIVEKEPGDSRGGRRPILLAINPSGGNVIGIKVMGDHLVGALVDLEATVLMRAAIPFAAGTPEQLVEAVSELVSRLIETGGVSPQKLIGIGVGLPGIIDAQKGILRQTPFFNWQNLPIREMLSKKLEQSVYIDNDVNTLTLAEKLFGAGQGKQQFLVLTIGRGIGLGIVINGQLYHGVGGGAGEFGHTLISPNGPRCDCGKSGCLEAYIGEKGLLQSASSFLPAEAANIDSLVHLASIGNPEAVHILSDAGAMLGRAVSNLVNTLNPECLIISGEGIRYGDVFFDAMRSSLNQYATSSMLQDLTVRIDPLGDDAWARGAASLALDQLFAPPVNRDASLSSGR
jgi:predicted NBD/HSP70 family sugar kinase